MKTTMQPIRPGEVLLNDFLGPPGSHSTVWPTRSVSRYDL